MLDHRRDMWRKELKDIMGWNGSGQSGATQQKPKVTAKKPLPVRGLVAGVVVVTLALVAYFAFFTGSEKPQTEKAEKEHGRIKEVKPAAAPKAVEVVEEKKNVPYWERDKPDGLTGVALKKWRHHHMKIPFTNDTSRTEAKPKYMIFNNGVDNRLACYLTLEPGETLVGTPSFGENFRQQFMKSLEMPIIVSEDDDEYTKELKRAVRDAKIELANRVHDGEDICKIFEDIHNEMQRYAILKNDLNREFLKLAKQPGNTIQDVEDYFAAANKMLADKGIAPLKMSPLMKEAIRINKDDAGDEEVPEKVETKTEKEESKTEQSKEGTK